MNFDFVIADKGIVSGAFLNRNINTFRQACHYISELPYGRNRTKQDQLIVFKDQCGTCSTKHALLKRLGLEHNRDELKLQLVIFKMSALNEIIDCTFPKPDFRFLEVILSEMEIAPDQISDFKVGFHQNYLEHWIEEQDLPYSWSELWQIREICIGSLSFGSGGQHTSHFQ